MFAFGQGFRWWSWTRRYCGAPSFQEAYRTEQNRRNTTFISKPSLRFFVGSNFHLAGCLCFCCEENAAINYLTSWVFKNIPESFMPPHPDPALSHKSISLSTQKKKKTFTSRVKTTNYSVGLVIFYLNQCRFQSRRKSIDLIQKK